jgi:hypothetical protein
MLKLPQKATFGETSHQEERAWFGFGRDAKDERKFDALAD